MFPRIIDLNDMGVSSLPHDFLIDSIFSVAGYETALVLQGFFEGNEEKYIEFFRRPARYFDGKSLAEACLNGRTAEVRNFIGRLEHSVFT